MNFKKATALFVMFLTACIVTLATKLGDNATLPTDSTAIIQNVDINIETGKEYIPDLTQFNISNTATNPQQTSIGINTMLQYASQQGYTKITMPKGEYLIDENNPIIMVSNIILDLNQSTFKINPNGMPNYVVINFQNCKNAILTNGIIQGDRYQHDYTTIESSHEWTCGVVFNSSENCQLDNVTIKDFPGYGISSSLGENKSEIIIGIIKDNLQIGSINKKGELNTQKGTIRTIEPIDITATGGAFEIGYNKGYMGYPYLQSKQYDVYFYDSQMNYISNQQQCLQYKKIQQPDNAKYAHFVFNQEYLPKSGDTDFNSTTVFITNYQSPHMIKISNCIIEGNRSLGMGLCGGRNIIIENNIFKQNGGGAPGYAVDLEDGWEYMDGYLFKGNKFIDNNNDVVICAGDNIIFEENEFTSTVYMWGRATNYKFINNSFKDIAMNINYEYSSDTVIEGNTYENCKIAIGNRNDYSEFIMKNETIINTPINTMPDNVTIEDSNIQADEGSIYGSFDNCNINIKSGSLSSVNLYNCTIYDTNGTINGISKINNCTIKDSSLYSTSGTDTIQISESQLNNFALSVSTWGEACSIIMDKNTIEMTEQPLIGISAGKMRELLFENNKVNNISEGPVFNLYDTGYSEPNGEAVIKNNEFIQDHDYIFDGVKIVSGRFKITYKKNQCKNDTFINPQYLDNEYVKVNY